jgi:hypothetical protein
MRRCYLCGSSMGDDVHALYLRDGWAHVPCASKEVRRSVDLVDLASHATTLRRAAHRMRGCCPFHNERTPSFYIEERDGTQFFACYGASCGVSGDALDFWTRYKNIDINSAIKELLGGGIPTTPPREPDPPPPPPRPLRGDIALRFHHNLTDEARAWWHQQGCTDEVIRHFQLGYCQERAYTVEDRRYTCPSYTIPIYDATGALVNIRHRLASPVDPGDKYRPHTSGRGAHLFGLPELTRATIRDVIVTEGEKKAMVWWRFDKVLPAISATVGAEAWLRIYRTIWPPLLADRRRVYIIFDPGAEDAAERTAALFGRRGVPVFLPDKLDDLLLRDGMMPVLDAMIAAQPHRATSVFTLSQGAWA